MADKRLYTELREVAWRRKFNPGEDARLREWLAAHSEDLADWEAETALNECLARLPDAPVPSNFTALVLQEIRRPQQTSPRWWPRLGWLPRVAFACAVLALGLFGYHRFQESEHRQVVRTVSVLSEVAAVPSPEVLKDFEVIRVLGNPPADDELLTLMQ